VQWADGAFFRFSTSFLRIRCDRKFSPPVIRRGEKKESVDRTRIGASAVTCENRKRELSLWSFCTCYFLFFFHPSGRSAHLPSTLLFAPFLLPAVSHFRVCLVPTWKSAAGEKGGKRGRKNGNTLFLETLFYTSVRLTLQRRNENYRLKTRSRVIGALMWF